MIFKRMLGAFGVGAPSVDTVLSTPRRRGVDRVARPFDGE